MVRAVTAEIEASLVASPLPPVPLNIAHFTCLCFGPLNNMFFLSWFLYYRFLLNKRYNLYILRMVTHLFYVVFRGEGHFRPTSYAFKCYHISPSFFITLNKIIKKGDSLKNPQSIT
jgi:tellurite resistance protein TehA-like permease